MKTKNTRTAAPDRINIKVSAKAYRALSKAAKREGRTILATIDRLLGV